MLAELLVAATVATATQPPLDEALALLQRRGEGESVEAVGPVQLAGFNFSRTVRIGPHAIAIIISTMWDSGVLLFGPGGAPVGSLKTDEVLRLWATDLDRDGTLELLTEERLIRGTGIRLCEFRLYSVVGHPHRLWSAESSHFRVAAWTGVPEDRQSFVRIVSRPEPHLQYRFPCGAGECVKHLTLSAGSIVER